MNGLKSSSRLALAAALAAGFLGASAVSASAAGAIVAFLMPDQGSTRYEEHDRPGFVAEMKKLCADCTVLYQNADTDATKQQQQFNSVIAQGAKVIVLDPVDSSAAASLVAHRAEPGRESHRLRPPDSEGQGRLLRLVQQRRHRQGDRRIARRAFEGDQGRSGHGRRSPDQRLAHRRRGRSDQEGRPRRPRQFGLQDPRRIRHAQLDADATPKMDQRPDHPLRREDPRRRARRTTARAAARSPRSRRRASTRCRRSPATTRRSRRCS